MASPSSATTPSLFFTHSQLPGLHLRRICHGRRRFCFICAVFSVTRLFRAILVRLLCCCTYHCPLHHLQLTPPSHARAAQTGWACHLRRRRSCYGIRLVGTDNFRRRAAAHLSSHIHSVSRDAPFTFTFPRYRLHPACFLSVCLQLAGVGLSLHPVLSSLTYSLLLLAAILCLPSSPCMCERRAALRRCWHRALPANAVRALRWREGGLLSRLLLLRWLRLAFLEHLSLCRGTIAVYLVLEGALPGGGFAGSFTAGFVQKPPCTQQRMPQAWRRTRRRVSTTTRSARCWQTAALFFSVNLYP